MLSKNILDALNNQLNHEFYAAHAYMAMAAYCADKSYDGFANFYIQQAKEERFHGMKIYDYINDRGEKAIFTALDAPKTEFSSLLETFKDGLAQEQDVTRRFYNLSEIAKEEKDFATISFLNWFSMNYSWQMVFIHSFYIPSSFTLFRQMFIITF
jgi:ferritin